MSILNRYGPCWGLRLFRLGKHQIELWFCPSGYQITPHCHPNLDIELFFIWGIKCYFERYKLGGQKDGIMVTFPKSFLKRFTIKNYHFHWFKVSKWPLVFINYERWIGAGKPLSASKDFLCQDKEDKQTSFH